MSSGMLIESSLIFLQSSIPRIMQAIFGHIPSGGRSPARPLEMVLGGVFMQAYHFGVGSDFKPFKYQG
jgi:hypothetical protein